MSQTEKRLMLQGREIILLGTAHISQESIVQVTTSIREEKPDCVAIELDEQRYASMKNPEAWKNLDIVKVLKSGQGFVLMANLVLSSFQKRMGKYDKSRNIGFVITFKFFKQSATDSAMYTDDICYHSSPIGLIQCNDNCFLRNITIIHL